jgi:fumigallin biosynthesis monooxygenase-like protein
MAERGRWTHDRAAAGDDLVVFLIGMHLTKPWRVRAWLPVLRSMGPMLAELSREPARGLLGFRALFGRGGPTVVQYWRDVDSLYAYASDSTGEHRPAWARFNRLARESDGAVGIWHETYPTRGSESVYVDMPALGLDRAVGRVPVGKRHDRARARLEQVD